MKTKNLDKQFKDFHPSTITQSLIHLAGLAVRLAIPGSKKHVLGELRKVVGQYPQLTRSKPSQISQALYRLKQRKLIHLSRQGEHIVLELSEKGRRRYLRYIFETLKIPAQIHWDGRWRFVMFDIPEDKKVAREALRAKLKHLGFLQFQKSVWIYPYPCEDEIDFLVELFSIGRYLNLLTVEVEGDHPLRRHFRL